MPLPLLIAAGGILATVGRVAAIFGIGMAIREVRKTAEVVPKSGEAFKSLALPLTLVGAALFVRAIKGKR